MLYISYTFLSTPKIIAKNRMNIIEVDFVTVYKATLTKINGLIIFDCTFLQRKRGIYIFFKKHALKPGLIQKSSFSSLLYARMQCKHYFWVKVTIKHYLTL